MEVLNNLLITSWLCLHVEIWEVFTQIFCEFLFTLSSSIIWFVRYAVLCTVNFLVYLDGEIIL